eukprot:1400734-Pyramimonas_sp.AAC.1
MERTIKSNVWMYAVVLVASPNLLGARRLWRRTRSAGQRRPVWPPGAACRGALPACLSCHR